MRSALQGLPVVAQEASAEEASAGQLEQVAAPADNGAVVLTTQVVVMTSLGLPMPRFATQVMQAVTPHVAVETWAEFSSRLPSQQVGYGGHVAGQCDVPLRTGARSVSHAPLGHALTIPQVGLHPNRHLPAATCQPLSCLNSQTAAAPAGRAARSAASTTCTSAPMA